MLTTSCPIRTSNSVSELAKKNSATIFNDIDHLKETLEALDVEVAKSRTRIEEWGVASLLAEVRIKDLIMYLCLPAILVGNCARNSTTPVFRQAQSYGFGKPVLQKNRGYNALFCGCFFLTSLFIFLLKKQQNSEGLRSLGTFGCMLFNRF